jgi:hypothetical protein
LEGEIVLVGMFTFRIGDSRLITLSFLIIIAVGGLIPVVLGLRREMPFQEIIPLDKGAAVINAAQWNMDKIVVQIYSGKERLKKGTVGRDGVCLFRDLLNGKGYRIEIKRKDLKGRILYKKLDAEVTPRLGGVRYYILVGASVGKAWEFEKLTERLNIKEGIVLGNRTKYDFDKSSAIESIIENPVPVSGVIIKECAAYFPRELVSSQEMIKGWAEKLALHGIKPILATVVPVTEDHDKKHPGRFNSIIKFNDFIREYALKKGIQILDLEKALRIGEGDRHLKGEYAATDGLHLVKKAYSERLDRFALPILEMNIRQKAVFR